MAGSMDSKITQINPETGEVIEGVLVWMPKKRVSPFERHFTMNQAGLLTLAQNLTGEQLKVLLTLLADLDYKNYIQEPQSEIAEKHTMQKTHVRRSVKALINLGVVVEGLKVGKSKTYRLNEQFGWKGSVSKHKQALKNGLSVITGGRTQQKAV